ATCSSPCSGRQPPGQLHSGSAPPSRPRCSPASSTSGPDGRPYRRSRQIRNQPFGSKPSAGDHAPGARRIDHGHQLAVSVIDLDEELRKDEPRSVKFLRQKVARLFDGGMSEIEGAGTRPLSASCLIRRSWTCRTFAPNGPAPPGE